MHAVDRGSAASPAPTLEGLRAEFEDTKARAREVSEGLSVVEFNEHPRQGAWSICECLGHLVRIGAAYVPVIEEALDRVSPTPGGAGGSLRFTPMERLFVWLMEPPPKIRFPAPSVLAPPARLSVLRVLPPYLALQDRLIEMVARTEQLGAARARVVSPTKKLLRMSLGACFAVLSAHERRHLWQAELVREGIVVRPVRGAPRAVEDFAAEEDATPT